MQHGDKDGNHRDPQSEFDALWEHIDEIKVAMLTTRRADGHLRSRAMATQKKAPGADLWFVTEDGSSKLDEIADDPHVNLSYFRDKNYEWVSVSGVATISRDRRIIHELYAPDWKMWFWRGGRSAPRHAGRSAHGPYWCEHSRR